MNIREQENLNRQLFKAESKERIEDLLKQGANPNWQDPATGRTALFGAGVAKVNALVKGGVDVNIQDNQGHNALWDASHHTSAVLLRHGIDPNAREVGTGRTALFNCVDNPCKANVILSARPDALWPNDSRNHGKSQRELVEAGRTWRDTDRRAAAPRGDGLGMPVRSHGDGEALRDKDGRGPLHYAGTDTAKVLMAYGANPEMKDNDRRTPRHYAEHGLRDYTNSPVHGVEVVRANPAKMAVMENPKQYQSPAQRERFRGGQGWACERSI